MFYTLDENCGYWEIPVVEKDKDKTFFTTHSVTLRKTRFPFGLRNAPETFKRALEVVHSGVRWKYCLVYLEDVIVFSPDYKQKLKDLEEILGLLDKEEVTLKKKKGNLFRRRVDYLGHTTIQGRLAAALGPTRDI